MELKELVTSSGLKDYKRRLEYYRNKIFENRCEMSRLTFDRSVGLYAFNYDKYMDNLFNGADELEKLDDVKKYIKLRGENAFLESEIDDYFRQVNINFRYDLCDFVELPNIYVRSNYGFTHIIDKYDYDKGEDSTLVLPIYDLESNRDLRHFYNKTSFHYLESLIDDCDFDISNKKLGKVLIK